MDSIYAVPIKPNKALTKEQSLVLPLIITQPLEVVMVATWQVTRRCKAGGVLLWVRPLRKLCDQGMPSGSGEQ